MASWRRFGSQLSVLAGNWPLQQRYFQMLANAKISGPGPGPGPPNRCGRCSKNGWPSTMESVKPEPGMQTVKIKGLPPLRWRKGIRRISRQF